MRGWHLGLLLLLLLGAARPDCDWDDLDDEDECPSERHYPSHLVDDFTTVTALFDLKRETWPSFQRTFRHYLNYVRPLLSMDVNLVVFVEESSRAFIEEHRWTKQNRTAIYTMNMNELVTYKHYEQIKSVMASEEFRRDHQLLEHPEGFSPEYNILMNSKFWLLYQASLCNPFNSTFFYWMDAGYGHGADVFPSSRRWAPANLMDASDHRVTYIMVQWLWEVTLLDVHKKKVGDMLNGGFFGGTGQAVRDLYLTHKEVFELCLNNGIVDDDQTMVIGCIHKNRKLFNLVPGDWYDVFKLFH